ncbi:MAG: hypothetical protein HC827_13540 [Cyanobacteria bacterium RM1_2_2]|nr:hypothetical protein [Cyanobacteria bacterium RM1_2_2]
MVQSKVQKLVYKMMQKNEEPVRFSITLSKVDNVRLEKLAELTGRSKSAFCSELISAALDEAEEMFDAPDSDVTPELPSADEYVAAFSAIQEKLTDGNRAMLSAHYQAPDYTMTTPELAKAAGYENYGGANLQYARLGKMIASYLNWPLPKRTNGLLLPTGMIVRWTEEDVWYCTLHPQVVKALEIVGLVEKK